MAAAEDTDLEAPILVRESLRIDEISFPAEETRLRIPILEQERRLLSLGSHPYG
jgi:hypothetical protein